MKTILLAMALCFGIAASEPANATFLFKSIPNLTVAPQDLGRCSACANVGTYEAWDTFTLTAPATITNIQFVVSAVHDFPPHPTILIYSHSNGLPGSFIWSQRFRLACTGSGTCPGDGYYTYTLTQFDTAILSANPDQLLHLDVGTYDISFYDPDGFYLADFRGGSGLFMQSVGPFIGGSSGCPCIYDSRLSLGFWLQGNNLPSATNVPEPSTFSVFVAGLLLFAGVQLGRDRRSAR